MAGRVRMGAGFVKPGGAASCVTCRWHRTIRRPGNATRPRAVDSPQLRKDHHRPRGDIRPRRQPHLINARRGHQPAARAPGPGSSSEFSGNGVSADPIIVPLRPHWPRLPAWQRAGELGRVHAQPVPTLSPVEVAVEARPHRVGSPDVSAAQHRAAMRMRARRVCGADRRNEPSTVHGGLLPVVVGRWWMDDRRPTYAQNVYPHGNVNIFICTTGMSGIVTHVSMCAISRSAGSQC